MHHIDRATPLFTDDEGLFTNALLWRGLVLLLLVLLWATGCGPTQGTADGPKCLKLTHTGRENAQTNSPSNVSIFFAFDRCECKPGSGLPATAVDITEHGQPLYIPSAIAQST